MLRGSQKSKSVSDLADVGAGDGEGESEGQELMERRSEAWLAVTEGGWMKTNQKLSVSTPSFHNAPWFGDTSLNNIDLENNEGWRFSTYQVSTVASTVEKYPRQQGFHFSHRLRSLLLRPR